MVTIIAPVLADAWADSPHGEPGPDGNDILHRAIIGVIVVMHENGLELHGVTSHR